MWCVCVKVSRRRDQKVLGCLVHAYTVNIELCGSWIYYFCYCISFMCTRWMLDYLVRAFVRTLWILDCLVRAYALIIGFSALNICSEYSFIWFIHILWVLDYLVHPYAMNIGLSELCIGYGYCIRGHCSGVVKSQVNWDITHCRWVCTSWHCKGSCYLLHSQQFRLCGLLRPLTWGHYNPSDISNYLPNKTVSHCRMWGR